MYGYVVGEMEARGGFGLVWINLVLEEGVFGGGCFWRRVVWRVFWLRVFFVLGCNGWVYCLLFIYELSVLEILSWGN